MKLRSSLGYSAVAITLTVGIVSCGDDEGSPSTPADAGDTMTAVDTSESSGGDSTTTTTPTTTTTTPTTVTSAATETSMSSTSSMSLSSDAGSTSSELTEQTMTGLSTSAPSSETTSDDSTFVVMPCEIPSFQVFTRSDTDASWDDNDFSSVVVDSTGCPPAVYVDATWPHEEGWAFGDPSEANREQTHFTLDSYAANNLVDKLVTATVELVEDVRGESANAGGYLVSIVSVATYDQIVELEPVEVPDAGPDAGEAPPQTVTQTGYTEAETAPEDRVLLRYAGDRATITFRAPMKTEEVDSFDPTRVIKVNVRFYNVFEGVGPEMEPMDAGVDAAYDASFDATEEGDPSLVYDYISSRFAITKFTITDVPGATAQ